MPHNEPEPVFRMLEERGPISAPCIAFYADMSAATVRRRLLAYEHEGRVYRHLGNGTYMCPDMWAVAR